MGRAAALLPSSRAQQQHWQAGIVRPVQIQRKSQSWKLQHNSRTASAASAVRPSELNSFPFRLFSSPFSFSLLDSPPLSYFFSSLLDSFPSRLLLFLLDSSSFRLFFSRLLLLILDSYLFLTLTLSSISLLSLIHCSSQS